MKESNEIIENSENIIMNQSQKTFEEKTLKELREESFQKPNKLYDKLNVSVKSLDIFLGVLFVLLILALVMGAK
mgnify:CR=1 FL=1